MRDLHPFELDYLRRVRERLAAENAEARYDEYAAYARRLMVAELPVIFSVSHLAFVLGMSPARLALITSRRDDYYALFRIKKRRGGSRQIKAPKGELKRAQRLVQRSITSQFEVSPAAHGFRRGRSIVTNARPHVGTRYLVQYDLADFFGSVTQATVLEAFRSRGYAPDVAKVLTDLCTHEGSLPQGAPTSPDLSNFAARRLDKRLLGIAASHELTYTRYADDLTFSGETAAQAKIRHAIEFVVSDSGFRLQRSKSRVISRGMQQRVTGIVVNDKLNWPRDRQRWLRQEVHYLRTVGVEEHLKVKGYPQSRYREFIYGHAYALASVRPDKAKAILEQLDQVDWPSLSP